jgi:hypothetical protein
VANSKFRRDSRELDKVLKELTRQALREKAEQIRQATGHPEDYEIQERTGPSRAAVTVRTVDEWPARAREARDHNLIRGLGSSGA